MVDADETVRDAISRLGAVYRDLDDLWAAQRNGPHRDAYHALGYALCALDDAREGLERAYAAYAHAGVVATATRAGELTGGGR